MTWRKCGHPRSPGNITKNGLSRGRQKWTCRACRNARTRRWLKSVAGKKWKSEYQARWLTTDAGKEWKKRRSAYDKAYHEVYYNTVAGITARFKAINKRTASRRGAGK